MSRPRESGSILAFTGLALLTLVGMTVVGVDLGRLAFTATEVQTVAEVAATAYAHEAVQRSVRGDTTPWVGNDAAAAGVIALNRIDGQQASDVNVPPGNYTLGSVDIDADTAFVPGGTPTNAVKATAVATVNNFFASVFGASQSTVTKTAVATLGCGDRARPLPLAIQDCQFQGFTGPDDCSELPALTSQGVSSDNACWTDLNGGSFNIVPYIQNICGLGGSATTPSVSLGDVIHVSEGNHNSACMALADCWNAGIKTFTVPIVHCLPSGNSVDCASQSSGNLEVIHFASITLDAEPDCGSRDKLIVLHSFCNADSNTEGRTNDCLSDFRPLMVE